MYRERSLGLAHFPASEPACTSSGGTPHPSHSRFAFARPRSRQPACPFRSFPDRRSNSIATKATWWVAARLQRLCLSSPTRCFTVHALSSFCAPSGRRRRAGVSSLGRGVHDDAGAQDVPLARTPQGPGRREAHEEGTWSNPALRAPPSPPLPLEVETAPLGPPLPGLTAAPIVRARTRRFGRSLPRGRVSFGPWRSA